MTVKLDIKTKTVHHLDYRNFSDFITEIFGQEYDFGADQECGNDSSHRFNVGSSRHFLEYEREAVEVFRTTGKGSYLAGGLLQSLFEQGIIPGGEYLIEVSW